MPAGSKFVVLSLALAACWLALSGHYEPLLLILGVVLALAFRSVRGVTVPLLTIAVATPIAEWVVSAKRTRRSASARTQAQCPCDPASFASDQNRDTATW